MGLRRILTAITVGISFSEAAASALDASQVIGLTKRSNTRPFNQASKKDIYSMPNADAQYYKKHQHEIR